MSDSGLKSLYSVFIFILAFSIITFYSKRIKEEKRFKLEAKRFNELRELEKLKDIERQKRQKFWKDIMVCDEFQKFSCKSLDIFVLGSNQVFV